MFFEIWPATLLKKRLWHRYFPVNFVMAWNFAKKRLWHRCFPVNFVKFLRTTFLQNTSERLVLKETIWDSSQNCQDKLIFFNTYYLVQNVFVRIFPLICTSIINQNALCNKCVIQYTILYRSFQLVFNSKTFEFYPKTTQISFLKNKTGMKNCTRTKVSLKLICTFQAENTMSIRRCPKRVTVRYFSNVYIWDLFREEGELHINNHLGDNTPHPSKLWCRNFKTCLNKIFE